MTSAPAISRCPFLVALAAVAIGFNCFGIALASGEEKAIARLQLNFAGEGPVEAAQILDQGGNESFDGFRKVNFPQWVSATSSGVSVPGDGMAVKFGLSDGVEWRPAAEGGPDLSQTNFSIHVRLFFQEDGDLRFEQPGAFQLRWFTDRENADQNLLVGIVSLEGQSVMVNAPAGSVNEWHDYVMVLEDGDLRLYVDGKLGAEAPFPGVGADSSTGPLQIVNYSGSADQYVESIAIADFAVDPDGVAAFPEKP